MPNLTSWSKKALDLLSESSRKDILAAMARGDKLLFHGSIKPQALMDEGINFRKLQGAGEVYKPTGLFWADSPEAVDRLTFVARAGRDSTEPDLSSFIIGTTPASNLSTPIEDRVLRKRVVRMVEKDYPEQQGKVNLRVPTNLAEEIYPGSDQHKAAITRLLDRRAPITSLSDVDEIPGMMEHIQTSPGKVQAYWPKSASTYRDVPDIQRLLTLGGLTSGGVAALTGGGIGGAILGNSSDAEARAGMYEKMAPILGEELARKLQKNQFRALQGTDTQGQLGKWVSNRYPNLVETGEFGGQTLNQKVGEASKSITDRIKDNPLKPLLEMKDQADNLGMNPDQMAAAIRYQHVIDPEGLKRLMTDDTWSKVKKFAGISGVAGAVLGMTKDSDAFPLGKLSGVLKVLPKNASRHEEATTRLLGRVLNLQGPNDIERTPHTVVDVLKKGKEDYLVQVAGPDGKRRQLPMTKDYLEVLLGAHGTQQQLGEFSAKGLMGKLNQAVKGLSLRQEKRSNGPLESYRDFKAWNSSQAKKAYEIDPALVNDYQYLQPQATGKGEEVYLPKEYATLLSQRGYGNVIDHGPNPGKIFSREELVQQAKDMLEPKPRKARVTPAQLDAIALTVNVGKREPIIATEDQQAKAHKAAVQYYLSIGEKPANQTEYMGTYYNILDQVVKGLR